MHTTTTTSAIEFLVGGSSPYTSTDRANKNKIYINETIQKNGTNNTKYSTNNTQHSKNKYTYYQNTHTIVKNTHTLQNK